MDVGQTRDESRYTTTHEPTDMCVHHSKTFVPRVKRIPKEG